MVQDFILFTSFGIDAALEVVPPTVPGAFPLLALVSIMKQETHSPSEEPVGIVISRGWEPVTSPRFSAYMWAPGPEDEVEEEVAAA